MFLVMAETLGLLHRVAGGVLRRGLKFQICTNTLKNFFNNSGNVLVPPPISKETAIIFLSIIFFLCNGYELNSLWGRNIFLNEVETNSSLKTMSLFRPLAIYFSEKWGLLRGQIHLSFLVDKLVRERFVVDRLAPVEACGLQTDSARGFLPSALDIPF